MTSKPYEIPDVVEAVDVSNDPSVSISLRTTSPTRVVKGFAVPDGVLRVRVTDEKGRLCWRRIEAVKNTDTMDLTSNGQPQWMKNPIGRPRVVKSLHEEIAPSTALVGELIRVKEAGMRSDPVILAAESTPESAEVLNQVMLAIAEEAASLRFERQEAERNGGDTSTYSMRRVAALKAIGDTWIKRKEQIQNQVIDLESPSFQELFRFISETFTRAMTAAGVRQELSDSVISQFAKLLDEDWKNEAKSRMKGDE